MSVKITVYTMTQGICSLSLKEGEVLVVSFDDGTVTEGALSAKSLLQLLRMKFAAQKQAKAEVKPAVPVATPANNGMK